MLKTIDYASSFSVVHEHLFAFKRLGGWLTDSLEVWIDGQRVLLTRIGYRSGDKSPLSAHSYLITIDDAPVELLWKWDWMWRGDPVYIVLRHGSRILAKYGSDRAVAKIKIKIGGLLDHANNIVALRLLHDVTTSDQFEDIAREEFPIDNSFGSEALTVEQEVSRSISSSLSVINRREIEAHLKASVFSVIESQLSSHLERSINHTIGETLTRRQKVAFSVKAGQSVLHTILWKARCRTGKCVLMINGEPHLLAYMVRYGLSFEIASSPNLR